MVQAIAAATPAQIRDAPTPPPNPPVPASLGVDGDAPASIAAVYTASQFQDAFHAGVRDIEIRAHLDLRNLPIPGRPIISPQSNQSYLFGYTGPTTRSIRV